MKVANEMGKECENGNQNVYFRARKAASIYSPKLYSREGAAEMLGVSVSTLADYELGNTKVVPVAIGLVLPIGHSYLQYPFFSSGQLYRSAIRTTLSI